MYRRHIDWLMETGGPVIRYRTVTELLPDPSSRLIGELEKQLLQSSLVQKWLDRVQPPVGSGKELINSLHGCKQTCFENVAYKLDALGLKSGMPALDERMEPFLTWLGNVLDKTDADQMHMLSSKLFVTVNLCRLGYGSDPAVAACAAQYLDMLHETAVNGFDFLLPPGSCKGVPERWADLPIIKPEVGFWGLPNLNTLVLIAHLPVETAIVNQGKISEILEFIFDPRYVSHRPALSIGGHGRYHAAGYGLAIPELSRISTDDKQCMKLVGMLEILEPFVRTHSRELVASFLNHLNSYRTVRDTWTFPKRYLQEHSTGHWASGAFTALEEDRRKELAYEVESTFRMVRFITMTGLNELCLPAFPVTAEKT